MAAEEVPGRDRARHAAAARAASSPSAGARSAAPDGAAASLRVTTTPLRPNAAPAPKNWFDEIAARATMSPMNLALRSMVAVLFLSSWALMSCGGSSAGGSPDGGGADGGNSNASCGTVRPCGGNIVGTWKFAASCIVDQSILGLDATQICDTATINAEDSAITGMATFKADMTYSVNLTSTPKFKLVVPNDCLQGAACADIQAAITGDPTSDIQSASCSTQGSACVCNVVSQSMTQTETGTYTTSGSTLTSGPSADQQDDTPYCVQGNQLHVISVDMSTSMGAMGKVKITADIVGTKQ